MKPFIYGRRNEIHIIDIRETLRGLLRARKFITRVISGGSDVLFVGTKRQAREIIQEQAERCKMHYVSERWLGGTLTNFRTIRSRLQRLEELEALVGSPEWEADYSKKMKSMLARELKKIRTNLQGIRNMSRLPGALVIVDVRKEQNAVREARALGIPTICLIDTDGDPDFASIPIPGNDDAMRSILVITRHLADAIEEGMKARPAPAERVEAHEPAELGPPPPRRRGRRPPGGPRPNWRERAAAPGAREGTGAPVAEPALPAPPAPDTGAASSETPAPPPESVSDANAGGEAPTPLG
jgi:small subunit ribosomal protein S2